MATKRAKTTKAASADEKEGVAPATVPAAAPVAAEPARQDYVVFARRFRPQTFSEVAGQTAVTSALQQALSSGRMAQAYLLCGPRGVGKTSLARILAKALNCLNGKGPGGTAVEPCNNCEACASIQEGRALDVIEMDAATNRGIEEVRTLRDNVGLAPSTLRYKVYIIDEVHMLTREAWNAFLKTLEEPPAHVKFVFATTDPNNVPDTILSRCQRFDLRRINLTDIVKRLKQICALVKIEADDAALSRIASLARGGLRDAEGLLDQAVNLAGGKVTDEIVRQLSGAVPDEMIFTLLTACAQGRIADALGQAHQALEAGADPEDMLDLLQERLRGTLLAKVCGAESPLLEGLVHLKDAFGSLGGMLTEDQCLMLLQQFSAARRQMRDAANGRLVLELALIRAARANELVDLGKLVGALEQSGLTAPARAAAPPGGLRPNSPSRPAGIASPSAAAKSAPTIGVKPSMGPAPGLAQATSARAATVPATASQEKETEVEFDDAGALPLGSAKAQVPALRAPAVTSAPARSTTGEDAGGPRGAARSKAGEDASGPRRSALEPVSGEELQKLRSHPLIQTVLKETGGEIIGISRTKT